MREVILDIETTGLDYKRGDRIIEVACLELINHVATDNHLQFYCSTNKNIEEEALKIHGLSNKFLNKFPTFEEQAQKLLTFIGDDLLIIHNAEFDLGFINNELKEIGIKTIQNKCLDTVLLARTKLKTRIANLDYLCRRFSIDLESRKLHGALKDCGLLSEVYIELLGGKQKTLELPKEVGLQNRTKTKQKNNNFSVRKVNITSKELEDHKSYIKSIKNNIWDKINY